MVPQGGAKAHFTAAWGSCQRSCPSRAWRCEGRPPFPTTLCVCGDVYLTLPYLSRADGAGRKSRRTSLPGRGAHFYSHHMLGGGSDPPQRLHHMLGGGHRRGPPQRLVVRPSGPLILRLISQHFRGENHPLELHEP